MPIFEDELLDNISGGSTKLPSAVDPVLASPNSPQKEAINPGMSIRGGDSSLSMRGMSIEQIGKYAPVNVARQTFASPLHGVPKSELLENQHYPKYLRNSDLEDIYGQQQSWYKQLGNAAVKTAATTIGTFAQGFATIPNTISSLKGGVSELSGGPNGYEASIDQWLKNMEDYFPNYYTKYEREHPLLQMVPGMPGFANFWGDKVIKNLGFTAGAVASALTQDAIVALATEGIGEIPLIGAQLGKASLYLNKILTGAKDIDKTLDLARSAGVAGEALLDVKKLANAAKLTEIKDGFRYGMNLYGSARTEAAVEARDGYRQTYDALVQDYKDNHGGEEPSFQEIKDIEQTAEDAMNVRFGINMALLTVSNAAQFGNLFKAASAATKAAGKGIQGGLITELEDIGKIGLKEGSLDAFEKKVAQSIPGKIWEKARPVLANAFTEGVYEEGGQYAAERGVTDYYTRKYKNKNLESWNDVNEAMASTLKGLKDQFGSSEGIENMIIGAISALISGKGMAIVDKARKVDADSRLNKSINILNQYGITSFLDRSYDVALNSAGIAKDMEEAAASGDVFKYKNFKSDAFYNFVTSRLGYSLDLHDVTIEQLNMLKGLSKDEFEKTFGMDFDSSNQKTVEGYVDSLINKANDIKETHDSINKTFKNIFTRTIDPKTDAEKVENRNWMSFERYKDELVKKLYDVSESDRRIADLNTTIFNIHSGLSAEMVAELTNPKSIKQLSKDYEEEASRLKKTITEDTPARERRAIEDQIKTLRTASERILLLGNKDVDYKTFRDALNFELNNRSSTKDQVVGDEWINDLFNYGVDINRLEAQKQRARDLYDGLSSKEGFEKFFAAENEPQDVTEDNEEPTTTPSTHQFVNRQGGNENLQVDREYELPEFKKAKVDKIEDDRWQVTAPDGNITFHSSKEKAEEAAEDLNKDFGSLTKVKVVGLNPDGTVKVEDVDGNIQNISPDKLKGYDKVLTDAEKLAKDKGDIDTDQNEIVKKSGTTNTGNNASDLGKMEKESPLKNLAWLFTSTITESEDYEDVGKSKPHVNRARRFLNRFKAFDNKLSYRVMLVTANNEDALKMTGLTATSFGKADKSELTEEQLNSADNGFIAAVFIKNVNGKDYFVDENGKEFGEVGVTQLDLSKVVFQTMPTTSLKNSKGENRYRSQDESVVEGYQAAWKKEREDILSSKNDYQSFSFRVSRGIAQEGGDRNHVGDTLINESDIATQEGLIVIPTTGTVSHQGESINFPNGRPVFQYGDTLVFLNNTTFTPKQAETIYSVIKATADRMLALSKANKKVKIDADYSTFLQNVMYWETKGVSTPNQIRINTETMSVEIGKTSYKIDEIEKNRGAILDQLGKVYSSVNNTTLKNFNEPFNEFYLEDGELKERKWDNYQSYLLAGKYPDGSSRPVSETPLYTTVKKTSDAVPFNFKQKYAILNVALDIPKKIAPKVEEKKKELPAGTNEVMLGGGENITFTGTTEEDIAIVKDDEYNKAVERLKGLEVMQKMIAGNPELTPDQVIENTIKGQLAKRLQQPAPAPKAAEAAPVSTDARTDIEKQKDLENKVKELEEQRKALRSEDGSIPADKMSEFKRLGEEINKAKAAAARGNSVNSMLIKRFPKGADTSVSDPEALSAEDKKEAADIIEQVIQNSKTAEEALRKIKKLGYVFDIAVTQKLKSYLEDRFNPDAPRIGNNKDSFQAWIYGKTDAELVAVEGAKSTDDKATTQFTQSFGAFTVYEGSDGSYDVQDNTGEGIIAEYIKTKEEAVLIAKRADIERRRKEELNKGISAFNSAKTLESLQKAVKDWVDADITSPAGASVGVRGALQTPGGFERGKEVILEEQKEVINSVNKQINAKYDAELKALEGGKPAEAPKKSLKDTKRKPDNYRRVGNKTVETIQPGEIEMFKQWVAEVVPTIPYEILDRIVTTHDNKKAWGVFEEGVAKFYKGAERGTEYHEIGEAIWNSFLSPEEQAALIEEFKSKKGKFTDRESGKKIEHATATDTQAKERILDDFADFRLGKLPARTLGEKILKFFRNILEFFKKFVQKPSLKDQLFNAIESGKYKEAVIPESAKSLPPQYRRIGNLSEEDSNDLVDDVIINAANIMFGDNRALYDIKTLTSEDIFGQIKAKYEEEGKLDVIGGEEGWKELIDVVKQRLRVLKIEFNLDESVSINDENTNKNDYAKEAFSVDWKKNSPFAVKLLLGTLVLTLPTNQEGATNLKLPARYVTGNETYRLLNFSRAFATLMDKLSNTSSVPAAVKKLVDLAKADSNYVRLFSRLGGILQTNEEKGEKAGEMNFNGFSKYDWRLFINFMQTFTKQKPEALIQYFDGANSYVGSGILNGATDVAKRSWLGNLVALGKDKNSIVKFDSKDKIYKIDKTVLENTSIRQPQDKVDFLSRIGIEFPIGVYLRLKTGENKTENQVKKFDNAVSSIFSQLKKSENIYSIDSETFAIGAPLNTLAELYVNVVNPNQDTTHFNLEGKRMNAYADSNAPALFEDEFNEADNLDELLERRPELKDVFSSNALILKKGGPFWNNEGKRIKDIKVKFIEGSKDITKNKGVVSSKLTLGPRYTQEINQNINGNYYVLIPADGSTEWMMNLGNHFKFSDVESGKAWNTIYKTFHGYLKDEIALAKDSSNREKLANIKGKGKELRFFKEIISGKLLDNVNDLIARDATEQEISTFIRDNEDAINSAVKEYIDRTVEDTKQILIDNNQVTVAKVDNDGNITQYGYTGLNSDFATENQLNKFELTPEELNDVITFVNANYVINNIEYHKILFGDPYQFEVKTSKDGKTILDETKRIKSFLSPRRRTFDSPEYNTFLNRDYNKAKEIALKGRDINNPEDFGDPGYHTHKSYANTVTLADNNVVGSVVNIKGVDDSVKDVFAKTKETDGASFIMDTTYREVKLKNSQWDDVAEDWFQWQAAYTRNKLASRGIYKYNSAALQKQDSELSSTPEPKYRIEVLKPIVSGNKADKNYIDLVLDKFSQLPIFYSMVEGTNLEELYVKMWKEDVGYAVMASGRKVGVETTHKLYNGNGDLNTTPFTNIVKVPWKAYGIQVENSYEKGSGVTRGSQLTKMSSMDMFVDGEERVKGAKAAYERNLKIMNEYHNNAYKELLNKLGLEDLGNGFKVNDYKAIAETLEYEMLRREMSDNGIDTLQLDENRQFRIPFEASPSYVQIRSILFSMIDKALVSPKLHGGAYVQAPVTGWENAKEGRRIAIKTEDGYETISRAQYDKLSEQDKKKVVLTDDTLKFYENADGKRYCQVMLPSWVKNKFDKNKFPTDESIIEYLNTVDGGKILKGIGFRIPTQSMSSVEVFKVKKFLPESMGKTVIVPSEITSKAGSDFDIDKLNMYLKAVYVDDKGNVRMVKYLGSEEETKAYYSDIFDKKLGNKIAKKDDILEALQTRIYGLDDPKGLLRRYDELLDEILSSYDDYESAADDFIKDLEKLGDKNIQSYLKEKFVNQMYRQSLENEYYDSLEELITLEGNFERLISPVDDGGLKDIADKLDTLTGYNESNIKNRILDRNYMTNLRNAFAMAKAWVGIAAVNITHHSLNQKTKVYIDSNMIASMEDAVSRGYLGDGKIYLPHNTVKVDGIDRPSLSGVYNQNGEYISSKLSGYATSFVDVAKDPYILKIIKSNLAVGTFMFLERIGVPTETVAMFMNQPIIVDYLKTLDSTSSKNLFNLGAIKDVVSLYETKDKFDINENILNISKLENNITEYSKKYEKSSEQNREQHLILREFLKYAKMAENAFEFSQGINYDTTRFGNREGFLRKQLKTEGAIANNIIRSVKDVLDNSFIGNQADLIDNSMEALGEILTLDKNEFKVITDKVVTPYALDKYLSLDKFDKISNKIKMSFLDFIIQTKGLVNRDIEELAVNAETSIAAKLAEAKKAHPEMRILEDLEAVPSKRPNGAKTVALKVNSKDAYDENLYIGYMRELRDTPDTTNLYYDIVTSALLQGTYQSAVSIRNIIPVEDFSKIITPIIQQLKTNEDLEAFSNNNLFQRNNWKNEDIWYNYSPYFYQEYDYRTEEPVVLDHIVDRYGNEYEIYSYKSFNFPALKDLSIKSSERKVMILTEGYGIATTKDFLLVPKVVETKDGEIVDISRGRNILKSEFKNRKKKGDYSLEDVYGYVKVRNKAGVPLTFTEINKKTGEEQVKHVYKLVNLYGDGQLTSEYYLNTPKSVIDNGTVKVDEELSNDALFNYYYGKGYQAPVVKETTPVTQAPTSGEKINIYAGTGENAELSNFAIRPFTIAGETYDSVEQYFQLQKFQIAEVLTFDYDSTNAQSISNKITEIADKIASTKNGAELKRLGNTRIPGTTFNEEFWNKEGKLAMKEAMIASFSQNPSALKSLLATGNAELTHTQDNSKWGKEFPRILMEVRQELKPTQGVSFDTLTEFTPERKKEIVTNFATKYNMTEEQAINRINEALQKDAQNTINKLKECY